MPSLLLLSVLGVAALVTSFISGILGMAGGMILMGIVLAMLPLPAAMMLHGITQIASNGWRAWLWRNEVDWRVFRGYIYGSLAASSRSGWFTLAAALRSCCTDSWAVAPGSRSWS